VTLPESLTDNGAIDRNFRDLDSRVGLPTNAGTWFSFGNFGSAAVDNLVADRNYYAQIIVPVDATLTGLTWFQYAVGTGNTARVSLYDSAGARVANRTTNSAALVYLTYPKVAFDATYAAPAGVYFVNVVFANTQGAVLAVVPNAPSGTAAGPGSSATATSITPPTVLGTLVTPMSTY